MRCAAIFRRIFALPLFAATFIFTFDYDITRFIARYFFDGDFAISFEACLRRCCQRYAI